jgi:uncharacterized protein (TIGR04255 family)
MRTPEPTEIAEVFPSLARPPVVEVVCGVVFEPLPLLDGIVLGVYWDERHLDFPERHLQSAFADGPEFILGNPPLRAVMTSSDNVRVLQIQHDRFYMNWRAVGEAYPRFSSRPGRVGLLSQALREFGLLGAFCEKRQLPRPKPLRIELTKIDVIESQKHWEGVDDLARVVPITGTFRHADQAKGREFGLRFVEHDDGGHLIVAVNSVVDQPAGEIRAARIETRAIRTLPAGSDIESIFTQANTVVNRAFFKLLSPDELRRFGLGETVK